MIRYKKSILLFFFFVCNSLIFAQELTLTGKVIEAEGSGGMPGVNVVIKGTTRGVVTDEEGSYTINSLTSKDIIVFSFVSYLPQEFTVGGRKFLNVILESEASSLDEVVVRGYGMQKAKDVTGAISKVNFSDLPVEGISSVSAGLQGMSSGLQVSQTSGVPGAVARTLIRGVNSVSSGSTPLYIIDGMYITGDEGGAGTEQSGGSGNNGQNFLSDINPNDIESVTILKDASATAIYGSRGANGVIIITTKAGKKGEPELSFNYRRGLTTPAHKLQFADNRELLSMTDQAAFNIGQTGSDDPITGTMKPASTYLGLTDWSRLRAMYTNVDYVKEYLQIGRSDEANLSISNGNDHVSSYLSLGLKEEKGIAIGNEFKKFNIRSNTDYKINEFARVGSKTSYSYTGNVKPITGNSVTNNAGGKNDKGTIGGFWAANYRALPYFPIYDDDGNYFDPRSGRNIVASTDRNEIKDELTQNRIMSNNYLEIMPIKYLKLHAEVSLDYLVNDESRWISGMLRTKDNEPNPLAYDNTSTRMVLTRNYYVNYARKIRSNHDVGATIGNERNSEYVRTKMLRAENDVSNAMELGEFQNDGAGIQDVITAIGGVDDHYKFGSYFGRFNYKLKNCYLLEGSLRYDRSTKFDSSNWAYLFPAFSGGWLISEENFMKGKPEINHLKLRVSYGIVGNDQSPPNIYSIGYALWPSYVGSSSMILSHIGNSNFRWEKVEEFDLGIDYGLYKNRVSGSITYYNKNTHDMILNTPIPLSIGVAEESSSYYNVGTMNNSGIEIDLVSINRDKNKGIKWTTRFNFTTNVNKILSLNEELNSSPEGIVEGDNVVRVGSKLGAYYLAEYAGIDEAGYEIIYEIDQEKKLDGIYERTGNKVRATTINIDKNKVILDNKSGLPTWFGGITNTFTYKIFDLSIQMTYQGGNYIYDAAEEKLSYINTGENNVLKAIYDDSWTLENTDAKYPMLRWGNQQSPLTADGTAAMGTHTTRFLHRGDFLRVRSIVLGVNIPKTITSKMHLNSTRVFISANNVFTITSYKGYDPETVNIGSNMSSAYISQYSIPLVRSFYAGIDLKF